MPKLKTGWVAIATSGPVPHGATDGRFVRKEWLLDMAEVYNAKVFTAHIWPDHSRYNNGGTVLALKAEPSQIPELKDEITLYAICAPTSGLVRANREGYYTYPSIEVGENYRNTGKYYLAGLGALDDPGASGIEELQFSRDDSGNNNKVFTSDPFNLSENLETDTRLTDRIKNLFRTSDPAQDEDTMTPEQLAALEKSISDGFAAQTTAMTTAIGEAVSTQFAALNKSDDKETGGDKTADEQFAALQEENEALKTANTELTEKFGTLETNMTDLTEKFAELQETPSDGTQEPEPGANGFDGI